MSPAGQDFRQLADFVRAMAKRRQVEWRFHARQQCYRRHIDPETVIRALSRYCEVIENYPNDPRGHSCLVLTFDEAQRPLHVVLGVADPAILVIITVYEPDPTKWVNWRLRR